MTTGGFNVGGDYSDMLKDAVNFRNADGIIDHGLSGAEFEISTDRKTGFDQMPRSRWYQADDYLEALDGKSGSEDMLCNLIRGEFHLHNMKVAFTLREDSSGEIPSFDLIETDSGRKIAEINLDKQREKEKTRDFSEPEEEEDFEFEL